MPKLKHIAVILAFAVGMPATAADHIEQAQIVHVTPLTEKIYHTAQETCHYQASGVNDLDNTNKKIIGGVLAGAAGGAVGQGDGKAAAIGAGAVVGAVAAVGDDLSSGHILGGLTGGVLGHQFGNGTGNLVLTGIGAMIGAILGDNIQNRNDDHRMGQKKVCVTHTYPEQTRIVGYEVEYRHHGVFYSVVRDEHPGLKRGDFISVAHLSAN